MGVTLMSVGGSGCDGDEYSGRWVRAKIVR